jgi:hypothetical protein
MNEIKAPAEYQQVPVAVAREIAEKCRKDVVVIMSIDRAFDKTHFTTYGRSASDKIEAAQFGEIISAGLQCGGPLQHFEDFRTVDAAKRAEQIDGLAAVARATDHAIASLLACRSGLTDEFLTVLQAEVRAALAAITR